MNINWKPKRDGNIETITIAAITPKGVKINPIFQDIIKNEPITKMEKEKLICAECGRDELTRSGAKVYTTDSEEDFGDDIWYCQNCYESSDFITESEYSIIKQAEKLIEKWYLIPIDSIARENILDELYYTKDPEKIALEYGDMYNLYKFI